MITEEQVAKCETVLNEQNLGTLEGFPPNQGYTSLVCFVRSGDKVRVLKILKCEKDLLPEVERLQKLSEIKFDTAKVPKLISFGNKPFPYIFMKRVSGKTCKEKWACEGNPSDEETRRIGMMTGSFLAELYSKPGKVHDDLHPENILISKKRGRLRLRTY